MHPPYLAALFVSLIIAGASYKARHLQNPESVITILQSMFYLHFPANNPVFWTLKIEGEYYIFIGLFFALLTKLPKLSILVIMPLLVFAAHTTVANYVDLFKFLIFFLIGTTGYLIYTKKFNIAIEIVALAALVITSFLFYEFTAAIASFFTIMIILFFRKPVHNILEFPGEISYSVYLIHFVMGIKLINLLKRHVPPIFNWAIFIAALMTTFAIAWVFWKFIEKPCAELSNKVKYNKETSPLNYAIETK